MVGSARTRVIVYDVKIAGMFNPGEPATNWVRDQLWDIEALAQRTAPRGGVRRGFISGNRAKGGKPLRDSHGNTGTLRSGPYGARGSIYNTAPHAGWVHDGTRAIITGHPGPMAVPVVPGTRRARLTRSRLSNGRASIGAFHVSRAGVIHANAVRGQKGQPWLREAGETIARRYKAKRRA